MLYSSLSNKSEFGSDKFNTSISKESQTEEKKKSKKVGKNVSKKQLKKGGLDLDDLRKNKEINKIVKKQLRYLLKGKKNSNYLTPEM
jgi:hypothetical protein